MFLLAYFRDAAMCKEGNVAVVVCTVDVSNLRGWGRLMLWSSQHYSTNHWRFSPNWNVNMPAYDKGNFNSAYALLYDILIQGCTVDSEFLG